MLFQNIKADMFLSSNILYQQSLRKRSTCSINDDYEGGEFIVADKKYETKKGSAIIFPSNFMFPHEVKEVTKGERWSIVSWLM